MAGQSARPRQRLHWGISPIKTELPLQRLQRGEGQHPADLLTIVSGAGGFREHRLVQGLVALDLGGGKRCPNVLVDCATVGKCRSCSAHESKNRQGNECPACGFLRGRLRHHQPDHLTWNLIAVRARMSLAPGLDAFFDGVASPDATFSFTRICRSADFFAATLIARVM